MTLEDFFRNWYRPRRLLGCSESTVRQYGILFGHLERHLGRSPLLDDLTEDTIATFLGWLAQEHLYFLRPRRKPRTVNKARDQLLALARYASLKGLLHEVPDVRPLPEYYDSPTAYTIKQLEVLLAACRGFPGTYVRIPAGRYWVAVVLVLYDTGLRIGPVWKLRCEQVDRDQGVVHVLPENQKHRVGQRLKLHVDTVKAINRIWLPDRELLFPWEAHWTTRYNHYRAILRQAGLPLGRMNMFHRLRRTTATLMSAAGGDATMQLGHSSDAVTRRHYLAHQWTQAVELLPRPKVV